ncbi:MAG TPA: PadR family transcriptional regulator [Ktedonobacteraceae bacterium]|nr:PadR family transcriptional regulator [Ktedonobacteraceae bacterium]
MLPADESSNEKNDELAARGRNASPVYELFVLGELMTGPHYGYRLYEIIQRILGPFQRLSWGTLYPLFRRLEQQNLLISEVMPDSAHSVEGRGPQRKAYRITDTGREHFFALMLEPGEYSRDYSEVFTIKLSKFALLSREQQVTILQQRRDYLSTLRDYYAQGIHQLQENAALSKEELPYLLQIPDYHIHKCNAELVWIEDKIASLQTEKE